MSWYVSWKKKDDLSCFIFWFISLGKILCSDHNFSAIWILFMTLHSRVYLIKISWTTLTILVFWDICPCKHLRLDDDSRTKSDLIRKIHRWVYLIRTDCHKQETQFSIIYFLSYLPLAKRKLCQDQNSWVALQARRTTHTILVFG